MIVETKIKLLSPSNFLIRSSKEAFLASKIHESWQSRDEIFMSVSGVYSRKEFDTVIDSFIETGAVEENVKKKAKLCVNDGKDFRDYSQICFNKTEINEAPEIPENIKKEILFLYYYGKNMDYYRILNLNRRQNPTIRKINEKCRYYRSLFAGRNFEGLNLFGFRNKLQKVRKLINDACQLTDPEMKERYDMLLFSQDSNKENKQEKIQSNKQIAEKHFVLAMKHNSEKDFRQSYNEISIALHMDPDNEEYLSFKNEIKALINTKTSEDLFNTFKNDEFILFDEKKVKSLIDNILELNDGSAHSHLKLAKIASQKNMPEMALSHSYQAIKLDPDLKSEAKKIISLAKKEVKELGLNIDCDKTFKINKSNVLRRN